MAAVDQARLDRRARRCRHPHPRFRHLWRGRRDRQRPGRAGDLPQGRGRPHRRLCARRQRQRGADARLASGALATVLATRFATGHANDLTLSLHGTKGALRVETDGKESSSGLLRQGRRQQPLEEDRARAGAAATPAASPMRCAASTATRPSAAPPRSSADRRGVRERQVASGRWRWLLRLFSVAAAHGKRQACLPHSTFVRCRAFCWLVRDFRSVVRAVRLTICRQRPLRDSPLGRDRKGDPQRPRKGQCRRSRLSREGLSLGLCRARPRAARQSHLGLEVAAKRRSDLQAKIAEIETEFIPAVAPVRPCRRAIRRAGRTQRSAGRARTALPRRGAAPSCRGDAAPPAPRPSPPVQRQGGASGRRRAEPRLARTRRARPAAPARPAPAGRRRGARRRPVPEPFFPDVAISATTAPGRRGRARRPPRCRRPAAPTSAPSAGGRSPAIFLGVTLLALPASASGGGLDRADQAPRRARQHASPEPAAGRRDFQPGAEEAPAKPGEADAAARLDPGLLAGRPDHASARPSDAKADVMKDDTGYFLRIRSGASGSAIAFDVGQGRAGADRRQACGLRHRRPRRGGQGDADLGRLQFRRTRRLRPQALRGRLRAKANICSRSVAGQAAGRRRHHRHQFRLRQAGQGGRHLRDQGLGRPSRRPSAMPTLQQRLQRLDAVGLAAGLSQRSREMRGKAHGDAGFVPRRAVEPFEGDLQHQAVTRGRRAPSAPGRSARPCCRGHICRSASVPRR